MAIDFIGGAVIDTEVPIESTTTAIDRRMSERRHDPGGTIAIDAVFRGHQANIANFIAQPGVG